MYRAVVFDLFLTIGRFPEQITMMQVSEILVENGYDLSPQQLDSALSFTVFVDYLKKGFNTNEEIFWNVFRLLDVDVDSVTFHQIMERYEESKFTPYNDSASSVKKIKKMGLMTAIATTTPKCWFVQDIPEIVKNIDFVNTGFEAGCDKSNPRIFEVIFQKLNVKPEETVVIGDNPRLDIENSAKYGCTTILLRRNGDFPDTDLPDYKVTSLTEAVNIIEELLENGAPAGI